MRPHRLLALLVLVPLVETPVEESRPVGRGQAQEANPLAAFEAFIGRWAFPDAFLAENEWAREFDAEVYEWGARQNLVRLLETAHRETRSRVVFEGFVYWHPTEDRVKLSGYNVQERFYFEGTYTVLEPRRTVREYIVYYPDGYEHGAFPEGPARVREYRGERRLVHPDTMHIVTQMKLGDRWVRWPAEDAPPFTLVRAGGGI